MSASGKNKCETAKSDSSSSEKSGEQKHVRGVSYNAPGKFPQAQFASDTVTTSARKLVKKLTCSVEELRKQLKTSENERNYWQMGYTELFTDIAHLNRMREVQLLCLKREKEEAVEKADKEVLELKETLACLQQTIHDKELRIEGLEKALCKEKSDVTLTGDEGEKKLVVSVLPYFDRKYKFACTNCSRRFWTMAQFHHHKKNCFVEVTSRNETAVNGIEEGPPILERMVY